MYCSCLPKEINELDYPCQVVLRKGAITPPQRRRRSGCGSGTAPSSAGVQNPSPQPLTHIAGAGVAQPFAEQVLRADAGAGKACEAASEKQEKEHDEVQGCG